MEKKDVYYSYDIDSGEIVSKTRFNDDGSVDKWDNINEKGYSHDKFSDSTSFWENDSGDVYSREKGEDPDREWNDRDGVFGKPTERGL